jgi:hypothetical protein
MLKEKPACSCWQPSIHITERPSSQFIHGPKVNKKTATAKDLRGKTIDYSPQKLCGAATGLYTPAISQPFVAIVAALALATLHTILLRKEQE